MKTLVQRMALVCIATVIAVATAAAQSDRFEKTVPFQIDQSQTLGATVGPVQISTVKITNLGRGYGRGGIIKVAPPSELSTTLRLAFDVDNPRDVDYKVTFTVEFLDKNGKVIDRTTHHGGFEGESKTYTIEHPILEYVLPSITQVHVTLVARVD